MADEWFYQQFGREFGPVPFEMLAELAQIGQLGSDDLLRRGGSDEWIPAGSIDGLCPPADDAAAAAGTAAPSSASSSDDLEVVGDLSELNFQFADSRTPAPPTRGTSARSAPLERAQVEPVKVERPRFAGVAHEHHPVEAHRLSPVDDAPPEEEFDIDSMLLRPTERPGQTAVSRASNPSTDRGPADLAPAGAEASPASSDYGAWFVRSLGIELGPMSFAGLVAMASSGSLTEQDVVRSEFQQDWMPILSVTELANGLRHAALVAAMKASRGAPVVPVVPVVPAYPPPAPAMGWSHPDPHVTAAGFASPAPLPSYSPQVAAPVPQPLPQPMHQPAMAAPAPVAPRVSAPAPAAPSIDDYESLDEELGVGEEDEEVDSRPSKKRRGGPPKEDKWFCRIAGEEHGPLPFRQLKLTADAGRLKPSDQVRKGSEGRWVPAGAIKALYESDGPDRQGIDLEKIAGSAAGPRDDQPIGSSGAGSAGPSKDVGQLIRKAQHAAVAAAIAPARKEKAPPKSLKEQLPPPKVLIPVVIALVAVLAWKFMPRGAADRKIYEQFAAIHSEVKSLRDEKAADDQWTQLTNRVKKEIGPVLKELEKTAGARQPIKQQLLWAGRDCLIPMLGSARKKSSDHEKEFSAHMRNAKNMLDGKPMAAANQAEGED